MARYLIIAASSGIGGATRDLLRAAGHDVVTTARDAASGSPDIVLDATDFDAVDRAFATAGPIDGVACFAGSMLLKPAHLTSRDQYDAVIAASLTTAFATVRAAGRHMREGGSVVLVLVGGGDGRPVERSDAIAAAKAGVIGLMLSAAASYASQGLRINAVAPGLTADPAHRPPSPRARDRERCPSRCMRSGGWASPTMSRAASHSCSTRRTTGSRGQVLGIDGGLSHVRPKLRG